MKSRLVVLGAAALTAWGLKRHYADASPDDLLWILSPTAWLVGFTTGARFAFQPGEGYLSREHLFLIEKSCAGVNFMIAAFAMLVWALLHRVRSAGTSVQVFGVSLLASYSAAVVVNAVRIAMAMWLAAHSSAWSGFSAADVHRFEGVAVYFGGLVLLYEAVQRFDRTVHAFHRTAVPLASYYAVTLGIPLANGAAASGAAFARHALFVLIVPPILIVLGCAVQNAFSARLRRALRDPVRLSADAAMRESSDKQIETARRPAQGLCRSPPLDTRYSDGEHSRVGR